MRVFVRQTLPVSLALLALFACGLKKNQSASQTKSLSAKNTSPKTPNRFDSLAWPEVTTDDKFVYAERLAPAILAMIEEKEIPFSIVPPETSLPSIEDFLREGLPALPQKTPAVLSEEGLLLLGQSALLFGPDTPQWEAFEEYVLSKGQQIYLTPLKPPGAIKTGEDGIEIAFDFSMGFEWFSYLSCKALLRGDAAARADLLGESLRKVYRWTPGEEEFCLWALEGTREHLRGEIALGRAPQQEDALERLDKATRSGLIRGFVLVEFLLPRRKNLLGFAKEELDVAVEYLIKHTLHSSAVARRK